MELLQGEGYQVRMARSGLSGLEYIKKERFDLILLDIMMPKLNGYNLAKNIGNICPNTPFLFISAKSLTEDKIKGYELGAEDFVLKPFEEEELLCKIQVVLRRYQKGEEKLPEQFKLGKYIFDFRRHDLIFAERKIRLTEKENEVLLLLCKNLNQILNREEAVEAIYGKKDYFLGRSFDVYISRLRKLLAEDSSVVIENVYKVGFILHVGQESYS